MTVSPPPNSLTQERQRSPGLRLDSPRLCLGHSLMYLRGVMKDEYGILKTKKSIPDLSTPTRAVNRMYNERHCHTVDI